jgi:hypothetical protein
MINKQQHIILLFCAALLLCSCAARRTRITADYYQKNEQALMRIEQSYRALYAIKPFSIEFTDKSFQYISLEIITDSLKHIYEFEINEARLQDTLIRYGLPARGVTDLVTQMAAIHCIWINNLVYYGNNQQPQSLVYLSIRNVAINLPFTSEKYYILTFYSQPQYYDSEGQLLAGRNLRRLRKINGEIFRRINDKVCYTISSRFR